MKIQQLTQLLNPIKCPFADFFYENEERLQKGISFKVPLSTWHGVKNSASDLEDLLRIHLPITQYLTVPNYFLSDFSGWENRILIFFEDKLEISSYEESFPLEIKTKNIFNPSKPSFSAWLTRTNTSAIQCMGGRFRSNISCLISSPKPEPDSPTETILISVKLKQNSATRDNFLSQLLNSSSKLKVFEDMLSHSMPDDYLDSALNYHRKQMEKFENIVLIEAYVSTIIGNFYRIPNPDTIKGTIEASMRKHLETCLKDTPALLTKVLKELDS